MTLTAEAANVESVIGVVAEINEAGSIFKVILDSDIDLVTKDKALVGSLVLGTRYCFDYEITAKGNKLIKSFTASKDDAIYDPEELAQIIEDEIIAASEEKVTKVKLPTSAATDAEMKRDLLIAAMATVKHGGFALENDKVFTEALEKLAKPAFKAITGKEWK